MYHFYGNDVYMPRQDHGVPLTFRVEACCSCCAGELVDSDRLLFVLSGAGVPLVTRQWQLGELIEGLFSVELSEEESRSLPVGIYAWRLWLVREGETRNQLTGGLWIVGTQAKRS